MNNVELQIRAKIRNQVDTLVSNTNTKALDYVWRQIRAKMVTIIPMDVLITQIRFQTREGKGYDFHFDQIWARIRDSSLEIGDNNDG